MNAERICQTCGGPIIRRGNETPSSFRDRKYCGRPCYIGAMQGRDFPCDVSFEPTPEEIKAECRRIQAGWTDHEEQARRVIGQQRAETMECRIATERER